jgi:DNA-binding LytR/AlgR family response regulator
VSAREIQDQKAISPQAPRIAFKANGSIVLLDLADILAVQAEGNYVSLRPRTNPYLVH